MKFYCAITGGPPRRTPHHTTFDTWEDLVAHLNDYRQHRQPHRAAALTTHPTAAGSSEARQLVTYITLRANWRRYVPIGDLNLVEDMLVKLDTYGDRLVTTERQLLRLRKVAEGIPV